MKLAAQIEDKQLQEDVQQHTSNHQSQGIMPFNLHLQAMGSDMAAPQTGHHGTCSQNKNTHPEMPDAKQSHRSKQAMSEVHAYKAQQGKKEKTCVMSSFKRAAQIEDHPLEEDGEQHTSNHQSQAITPLVPDVPVRGSDVAAPGTGHRHAECQ
jgi:hypothetical protein